MLCTYLALAGREWGSRKLPNRLPADVLQCHLHVPLHRARPTTRTPTSKYRLADSAMASKSGESSPMLYMMAAPGVLRS